MFAIDLTHSHNIETILDIKKLFRLKKKDQEFLKYK